MLTIQGLIHNYDHEELNKKVWVIVPYQKWKPSFRRLRNYSFVNSHVENFRRIYEILLQSYVFIQGKLEMNQLPVL